MNTPIPSLSSLLSIHTHNSAQQHTHTHTHYTLFYVLSPHHSHTRVNAHIHVPPDGAADRQRRGHPQRLDALLHGGRGSRAAVGPRVVAEWLHHYAVARRRRTAVAGDKLWITFIF